MILINDIWYEIYDLHDCVKIIKENYNEELAKKIENLIPEHSDQDYYELQGTYDDLNNDMEKLEDKLDIAKTTIEELENQIDDLEQQLSEYEDITPRTYKGANEYEEKNYYMFVCIHIGIIYYHIFRMCK